MELANEKISIVIPVYKVQASYLTRCITSVLQQTYENIEVILVDDGCPIGGGEICDGFASEDPRIYVIHQENKGVSAARNNGMQAATGDYIMFVDSDDYVSNDICRKLIDAMLENNADLVVGGVNTVKGETGATQNTRVFESCLRFYNDPISMKKLSLSLLRTFAQGADDLFFPENQFPFCHLYRKQIVTENGLLFPLELTGGEDRFFNYFYICKCNSYAFISEPLYYYVKRPGSYTASFNMNHANNTLQAFRLYIENDTRIVCEDDYRNTYYLRVCAVTLSLIRSYFYNPQNPKKQHLREFRRFCTTEIVNNAIIHVSIDNLEANYNSFLISRLHKQHYRLVVCIVNNNLINKGLRGLLKLLRK